MKQHWIDIKAIAGTIILEVYGEIGYWGYLEEELRWQIKEHGDSAPIDVRINSIGGDPRTALALYSILRNHAGPTTAYIEFQCDSSATIVACGCDKVIGNRSPFEYMIHDPRIYLEWVTAEEGKQGLEYVEMTRNNMAQVYADFTGQSLDQILVWMKEWKWMTAEEALEHGFITEIKEVEQTLEAKIDVKMAANAHKAHRPKEFTIKGHGTSPEPATKTKPITAMNEWMKKLAAKLGLGDTADESDVVLNVTELKAKADTADALKADLDSKETEIATLKAEVEELKGKLPTEEAEEEEKNKQVDAELEAAVKLFKITAASKAGWKKNFEGKPDELKATLELIPENALKGGSSVQDPKTQAKASVGIHPNVAAAFGK